MAPRFEFETSEEVVSQMTPQLRIVGKAMELPLVVDAVSLTKSTISPLVETITPVAAKVEEQVASLKTRAEESLLPRLSEGTKTNLTSAVEQVSSAVASLDNLACGGLDQLAESVPVLKGPTSEVVETTKEVAANCVGIFTEYLASFTLAQVALKVGEAGLSMVDSTLKRTGLEQNIPLSIGNVRRKARALRRAGVRRAVAESSAARTVGEVSLLGAVAEILGVNFFLSAVGLKLVPSNQWTEESADASFDIGKEEGVDSDAEEEMTWQQRLGPEKIDAYESDKDPDYSPSEASEEASDVEDDVEPVESAVLYQDEHATVLAEAEEEQEPVVVDTAGVVVEDETKLCESAGTTSLVVEDSMDVKDSLASPLIDTQGFAAVSETVSSLEAAVVVSEKPETKEAILPDDAVEEA